MKPFASPLCVVKIIKHEKKPAFMRAGYFWWLQQKRCNELLHLWGMILPLCHRSFQFSPALAGVLLYKMNVATFQFSFLREERSPRKDMITQGNSYFNSRSLPGERYLGISAAGAPVDFNSRPRLGSDIIDQLNLFEHRNFNSRPLRGERSERWYLCAASLQFQFSLLAWGAI